MTTLGSQRELNRLAGVLILSATGVLLIGIFGGMPLAVAFITSGSVLGVAAVVRHTAHRLDQKPIVPPFALPPPVSPPQAIEPMTGEVT